MQIKVYRIDPNEVLVASSDLFSYMRSATKLTMVGQAAQWLVIAGALQFHLHKPQIKLPQIVIVPQSLMFLSQQLVLIKAFS